jgi:hypothetical protein
VNTTNNLVTATKDFAAPNVSPTSTASSTTNTPRIIQFALKVAF